MKHKIYQTNAGLGYEKFAFLLEISKNKHLVIGTNYTGENDLNIYPIGEVIENDLGDLNLEKTHFEIENSVLYNKELFKYLQR